MHRRRNGFKSEAAHLFRRETPENFLKSAPPLLACAPCGVGTVGHEGAQTGTASCEFSYFTAFILSP